MHISDTKLLISIQNTYGEEPVLIDGVPQSRILGHGYGTQSILHVTEKLHGNCQFYVQDGWFSLRIIL
ncbi:MAG: GHKL domain-containing protein [Hespellia sp.]|nr:GHKL domain-containing protein [Hespellia sp.]